MSTGRHREFWLVLLRSTHTDETISIATTGFFKGEIGERCEKPKPTQLQLPMHRVISQAGGVAVLVAGEAIPAVLGAVSAQVGVGDAFHLPLLSCRTQSPGGGRGSFWPWSTPVLLGLWVLPSPPSLSCFLLLCLLPSLGARETARRTVNDAFGAESFGNAVRGTSLAW